MDYMFACTLYNVANIVLFYIFANVIFDNSIKRNRIFYVLSVITVLLSVLMECYISPSRDMFFDELPFTLFVHTVCLYLIAGRKGNVLRSSFVVVEYLLLSMIVEILCEYLVLHCFGLQQDLIGRVNYEQIIVLTKSMVCVIKTVVAVMIVNIFMKKHIVIYVDFIYLIVAIVSINMVWFINRGKTVEELINDWTEGYMLICMFLLQISILVLLIRFSSMTCNQVESARLKQQIQSSEELYKKIEDGQNELRNIRHDMKNRLMGIYTALEQKEISKEEFQHEIASLIEEINNVKEHKCCNNTMVNSILNYKLSKAWEQNIKVIAEVEYPERLNIAYGDIGVILGNLIDNAIEACNCVNKGIPYITIRGYSYINMWVLDIENYRNSQVRKNYDVNHGRGLKNVRLILEKYNAKMKISEQKESYIVTLYFELH